MKRDRIEAIALQEFGLETQRNLSLERRPFLMGLAKYPSDPQPWLVFNARFADFLRNDDEVRFAIGHEYAHKLLRHNERFSGRQLAAEIEADTGGFSALKRTGADPRIGVRFLMRMAHELAALDCRDVKAPAVYEVQMRVLHAFESGILVSP